MKVCLITFEYPPEIIGGIGTYADQLVRGLDEKGVDTCVITRGEKTCCEDKVCRVFVPDILYWRRFLFINHAIKSFHVLNKRSKFDLIHLNGTYPIIGGLKLPTVATLHATPNIKQAVIGLRLLKSHKSVKDIAYLVLKNPVGSVFDITTVQASDMIICPGPNLVRDIRTYCFADKQKIRVIPNGIDLKTFDETDCSDTTLLDHYDIQKENFILYVGRLSFLKGIQYLIEAFKLVQSQHPTLKLVIVGRGDFEHELKRIAGNIKEILFVGHVSSMRTKKLLYDASLSVILPSSAYEVSPMTILEGMASSKPVIASNVEGNSFMIRHGENGFLSKPRDPANLAKFISILFQDEALRRKMGMLGRTFVEKEFTMEKMVSRTLNSYESLLN